MLKKMKGSVMFIRSQNIEEPEPDPDPQIRLLMKVMKVFKEILKIIVRDIINREEDHIKF